MKPIKTIINEILYGGQSHQTRQVETLTNYFAKRINERNVEMSKKTEMLTKRFDRLQRLRRICIEQKYFDQKLRCDRLINSVTHQLNSLYTLPEWN